MDQTELLRKARDAFGADPAEPPALTLRGASAVDGYDHPEPFDAGADEPTDAYLERLALEESHGSARDDARAALEEWWLPGAFLRAEAETQRGARRPTEYREAGGGPYRITLPTTLERGGGHVVPSEHRAIEVWRGSVCGDALADVFVNVYPLAYRSWREAEESASRWLTPDSRAWIDVPGAKQAL